MCEWGAIAGAAAEVKSRVDIDWINRIRMVLPFYTRITSSLAAAVGPTLTKAADKSAKSVSILFRSRLTQQLAEANYANAKRLLGRLPFGVVQGIGGKILKKSVVAAAVGAR